MSTDPKALDLTELLDQLDNETRCQTYNGWFRHRDPKEIRAEIDTEIARLTAELADEKAVNEAQRYELKDRLQKQLAAEAELKEARKIVQALECLFSPYATDSTQRDWMDRAAAMTKEKP